MTRFDQSVLAADPRRSSILEWLEAALASVEPESLTRDALAPWRGRAISIVAIGKAAPAMTRGAVSAAEVISGISISDHSEAGLENVISLIGDHPVPAARSLKAGAAVIDFVRGVPAEAHLLALISGGGSALCEDPRPGVSQSYLAMVNERLVAGGADIAEINLVRSHLSSIKCGGLCRIAGRPIDTYVISDVPGTDPGLVASGPTVWRPPQASMARAVMIRHGIEVANDVWTAMSSDPEPVPAGPISLLADGAHAARALAGSVGERASVSPRWLTGTMSQCLSEFFRGAGPGVNVAAGEPSLRVERKGRGGRNTHAALLAAGRIRGRDSVFASFATDGVDGVSGASGGVVDGTTIDRGGDPSRALKAFDSASYLQACGDLLSCPPTGTNVSDLWILWNRSGRAT
jgi:glycerate 2-kinase